MSIILETERLILRPWRSHDFTAFAALNEDPEVMEFFPSTLSRQESDDLARRICRLIDLKGWGFWAVEIPSKCDFAGFVGLNEVGDDLPFAPAVEIGWRLSRDQWGQGIATEAALKALDFAFESLGLCEVVSFTSLLNKRSQAVMRKIGMTNTSENFFHPKVPDDSPLKEHCLFKIVKN